MENSDLPIFKHLLKRSKADILEITGGSSGSSGEGDMTKVVYDPNTKEADCFDMDNMIDGTVFKKTHNDYNDDEKNAVKRVKTDGVFWLKGDGNNIGDIKAEVSNGLIQYVELTASGWEAATLTDINLSTHGSLNARLESMENAREFKGDIDGTGTLSQLDDAVNGSFWLVSVAGTLSGVELAINDMIICHTDVVGTPVDLSSFSHIQSTMNIMIGATSTVDGEMGAVPKPIAGQENYVLTGAGSFVEIPEADDTTQGLIKLEKDLGGTADNPKVVGLQGVEIDDTIPEADQALIYDEAGDKYVPSDIAKLVSPDTTKSVTVTDTGVGVSGDMDVYNSEGVAVALNGGLNNTSTIYFSEVGVPRFAVQYDGAGVSPNNLFYIKASPASAGSLSNTPITINQEGKVILGDTLTVETGIVSPDATKTIILNDINLKYNDGVDRLTIDSTKSKLTSPNGAGNLSFANDGFVCNDGANDRFKITGTESYVSSPDESNTLSVTDDETKVVGDLSLDNPAGITIKLNNAIGQQGYILFRESNNTYFGINHNAEAHSPNNKLHIKTSSNTDGVLDITAITVEQSGDVTLEKNLEVTGDLKVTGEATIPKAYGQATFSGTCVDNSNMPMSAEECSDGTYVTFDITNSTFTLKAGKTYKVDVVVGGLTYAAITDNVAFRIAKVGWITMLGISGRIYPQGSEELRNLQPTATAIITPTTDTSYRIYCSTVEGTVTVSSYYSGITITEL